MSLSFVLQMYLQYGLVAAAGISAGVMLLAKPLVLKYRHSKVSVSRVFALAEVIALPCYFLRAAVLLTSFIFLLTH